MKLENTAEDKAKFFAQHYRQKVMRTDQTSLILCDPVAIGHGDWYLELTPLSQITKEDAIDVFDLLFSYSETHKNKPKDFKIEFGKDWASIIFNDAYGHFFPKDYVQMIDFLRSKGYALPWMGISVETLTEWGWIKLKES